MRLLLLPALLPLAACGDGPGMSISINSTGADGNVAIGTGAGGEVAIDSPLFKGKVTLPKLKIDADDFDMNGVHLYPGSTISAMNVEARDGKGSSDKGGSVRVSFASPAAAATVRDWYREKLTAAGFTLSDDGTGLSGTTDEKQPFKLELRADGAAKSAGTIEIG